MILNVLGLVITIIYLSNKYIPRKHCVENWFKTIYITNRVHK